MLWVIAETSLCFKMLESNRLHSGGKTQKIMWTWIIFFRRVDMVEAKWHALRILIVRPRTNFTSVLKNTVQTPFFLFFLFYLMKLVQWWRIKKSKEQMLELGSKELILESYTGSPVNPMTHIRKNKWWLNSLIDGHILICWNI